MVLTFRDMVLDGIHMDARIENSQIFGREHQRPVNGLGVDTDIDRAVHHADMLHRLGFQPRWR